MDNLSLQQDMEHKEVYSMSKNTGKFHTLCYEITKFYGIEIPDGWEVYFKGTDRETIELHIRTNEDQFYTMIVGHYEYLGEGSLLKKVHLPKKVMGRLILYFVDKPRAILANWEEVPSV